SQRPEEQRRAARGVRLPDGAADPMNLFQTLVLGLFVVLAVLTVSAGFGGVVRKRIVVFWLSVWAFGACAIVWPHATAVVAHALGIGRGADLLLYSSVLVMFVAFF